MYNYTALSTTAIKFEKKIPVHYRHDHFLFTLWFLNYSSDVITAYQIAS